MRLTLHTYYKMIKQLNKWLAIGLLLVTILSINACTSSNDEAAEAVDTDNIKLELQIDHFEQDLFNAKNPEEVRALEKKYPDFYPVYMFQIMQGISSNEATSDDEAARNLFQNFLTVPDFGIWLKNRSDSFYKDFSPIKTDLTEAMKRYKYYFPKDTIPKFVTFLSPLVINFPVIEGRNIMGIGLDMYLGYDFKPYHSYNLADQFPNYRIRKMRKEYLIRDLVTAMAENKIKSTAKQPRLIDEMIVEGKILYMVNALIPNESDSIKMGYTPAQLKWAKDNESQIWAAMVDSKALYTTDLLEIRDFINDGPFTTAKGFGAGTAPRIGAFIGWQLIKKYMVQNPKITLAQLLSDTDTDAIVTKAKYKP